MSLIEKFSSYNREHQLINKKQPVLLAVSGGMDSAVLCHLFFSAGNSFSIAHCNFLLRGEESERDEKFTEQLALKYKVLFFIIKFETEQYARDHRISIQVAARELRYRWLEEMRVKSQSVSIATAHHRDDNVETILMNFCKGTGIAGLHGIQPRQGNLIRPLLFATRNEIYNYAKYNKVDFVTDSSNLAQKYTRNYFRQTVIPAIEKVLPEVKENIADNIHRFSEAEILYEEALANHRKKLLIHQGDEYHVAVLKLLKSVPLETIVWELFKPFSFQQGQVKELIKLLYSDSGKQILSGTHRVIRDRKWLIVAPLSANNISTILIEENQRLISIGNNQFMIEQIPATQYKIPPNNHIASLDAGKIKFPLQLRKWKQGDYFYPLGLGKKKKLSRFFIDQKLSLADKEKVWVITSGTSIIWVVGMRIDDRFKITPSTLSILRITQH
jgi:tRNA(Ile)-lysidine synthase